MPWGLVSWPKQGKTKDFTELIQWIQPSDRHKIKLAYSYKNPNKEHPIINIQRFADSSRLLIIHFSIHLVCTVYKSLICSYSPSLFIEIFIWKSDSTVHCLKIRVSLHNIFCTLLLTFLIVIKGFSDLEIFLVIASKKLSIILSQCST